MPMHRNVWRKLIVGWKREHPRPRRPVFLAALTATVWLAFVAGCSSNPYTKQGSSTMPLAPAVSYHYHPLDAGDALRVKGDQLFTADGAAIGLFGYKYSAAWACVGYGRGEEIWASKPPGESTIRTIQDTWHADVVRIPLNEDCWLSINGVNPQYSGGNYRRAIAGFVNLLNRNGIYADLDLHWNAPDNRVARKQQLMADADHSLPFWISVASAFKSNPFVLFELYNEPHLGGYAPTGADWDCWLNGCTVASHRTKWQTAGMQSLVDAVRATGAKQIVIVNGLSWANNLTGWLRYRPNDPLRNMAAGFHVHDNPGQLFLSPSAWRQDLAPVRAAGYPVIATEIAGPKDDVQIVSTFSKWANQNGISYIGWSNQYTNGSNDFSTVLNDEFAQEQARDYR